ncbi:hypothetical protein PGAL8A_00328800 [Plasmodium gallinaceum]|uniref:Uncharacterized protein n=1 Tax=Plasmodium gallinaceum TaxID=5849 RepID=A0A1J1GUD5_PLAGA|nr:hypothetical protein PGAL8A_00328800 [Plasmodium gallinaceum]CRG96074.1 hypothetical protein PGAL8A_00328800 [Plasmodium gallinaceum]
MNSAPNHLKELPKKYEKLSTLKNNSYNGKNNYIHNLFNNRNVAFNNNYFMENKYMNKTHEFNVTRLCFGMQNNQDLYSEDSGYNDDYDASEYEIGDGNI